MRMRLYKFLVNRHTGIKNRYHDVHDGAVGIKRLFSYVYLFWLNFCYYALFCRFLGRDKKQAFYEEKKLMTNQSESGQWMDKEELLEVLSGYDVISFDLFDTLLFRPFSEPSDLFYFLGETFGILDFKRIRVEQERLARKNGMQKNGNAEIALADIWSGIERETGIKKEAGMAAECALEEEFCYANPYMREVYGRLLEMGKRILAVSDMYLPADFLERLLEKCGYTGLEKVYVSNAYGKSKADGNLYGIVKEAYAGWRLIHIGDNRKSDVRMAEKNGVHALHYPNINEAGKPYRPYDMSPIIGSAYRGMVNAHLYNGLAVYPMEYEYGFLYGGIFVLGYCSFIHQYCHAHGMERVLFLSRDGDILKKAYDRLYPGEDTVYAYWSRAAAVKLMAEYDRGDYFRRYLYHKIGRNITVGQALAAMELEFLADGRTDLDAELTDKNVNGLKAFLQEHFGEILESYRSQGEAAREYYAKLLFGAGRAVAVDIGWAGSGAISLAYLSERVWKLPCEITGILAGTNTGYNEQWDAPEIFLQTGKLVSYLYSSSHNRDLYKKHDPGRNYNVYWELLLASCERRFLGFRYADGAKAGDAAWEEDGRIAFHFGKKDSNQEGVREIRRGILDFVEQYSRHFKEKPYMFDIGGRDAYAPMLAAAGRNEAYLKKMAEKFRIETCIE